MAEECGLDLDLRAVYYVLLPVPLLLFIGQE